MGGRRASRVEHILLIAVTVGSAVAAFAAALAVTPQSLGAATVAVGRCTAAGLGVLPNLTASTISSVTVSSLPAACGSATIQLTVNNGIANSSGSATVPAGGGAVTVTLGVALAVTTQVQTDFVLTGP